MLRKAASVEGHPQFEQAHGVSFNHGQRRGMASSEMQSRVVDDVQVSCYYQKVPRVKSSLPVYGGLIWLDGLCQQQAPGKPWLSSEEIRPRSV